MPSQCKQFNNFDEAKEFAINNPGFTLKCDPGGSGWIVQNTKRQKNPKRVNNATDDFTEEEKESDYQWEMSEGKSKYADSMQWEMSEEKSDYADSISRSNEDGWFYDRTDGDWENNLIDPDTERPS
tara:strand:- start:268 stop:645 length:378 start_codon:yes stop_codon:yes gene_type:complete